MILQMFCTADSKKTNTNLYNNSEIAEYLLGWMESFCVFEEMA
jgi:hypothetical protein